MRNQKSKGGVCKNQNAELNYAKIVYKAEGESGDNPLWVHQYENHITTTNVDCEGDDITMNNEKEYYSN